MCRLLSQTVSNSLSSFLAVYLPLLTAWRALRALLLLRFRIAQLSWAVWLFVLLWLCLCWQFGQFLCVLFGHDASQCNYFQFKWPKTDENTQTFLHFLRILHAVLLNNMHVVLCKIVVSLKRNWQSKIGIIKEGATAELKTEKTYLIF